jgi:hypothetical protein
MEKEKRDEHCSITQKRPTSVELCTQCVCVCLLYCEQVTQSEDEEQERLMSNSQACSTAVVLLHAFYICVLHVLICCGVLSHR